MAVAKLECQECHGPIDREMTVAEQWAPLTMGWCIECHGDKAVKLAGTDNGYYEEMHRRLIGTKAGPPRAEEVAGGREGHREGAWRLGMRQVSLLRTALRDVEHEAILEGPGRTAPGPRSPGGPRERVPHGPADRSVLGDPKFNGATTGRRDFLKFLGFSVSAATLAACETPWSRASP